jgi:adenylate kinase family enzyme
MRTGMIKRIHIFGASGSGTTTLAATLAEKTDYEHFNTDSYYFTQFPRTRHPLMRNSLLDTHLRSTELWILSGALCGWGDFTRIFFDLVVFLWVPTKVRLARLKERELKKYGDIIFKPNSYENKRYQMFMKWASVYDTGGYNMRSRNQHERWINQLSSPVIRLEGDKTVDDNINTVLDFMQSTYKNVTL